MSQTPETGQPARKRPWFRFSLRTLVIGVLLAGSGMGLWWRWEPWVLEWHVTRWQERKDGGIFAPKIAVSRDGSRFITINGYLTARMWDGETGRMLDAIRDECQDDMSPPFPDWKRCQGTWAAAFSRDGSRLLTACQGGAVTLRRAADGKELGRLRGHGTEWIFGCGFSPDSGHIVTYDSHRVAFWLGDGRGDPLASVDGQPDLQCADFSPDGRFLVTGDRSSTVKLWNVSNGELSMVLTGHGCDVRAVLFSPTGHRLASYSLDGARLWNPSTGELLAVLKGHAHNTSCIAFSTDGSLVATGSQDNTIRLWSAANGAPIRVLTGHENEVHSLCFMPDGVRILSSGRDSTVRVWDSQSGVQLAALATGYFTDAPAAACYPDGGRIVAVTMEGALWSWTRRRPERWWGVAWLPEFWLTVIFAGALAWSVWRDRRTL